MTTSTARTATVSAAGMRGIPIRCTWSTRGVSTKVSSTAKASGTITSLAANRIPTTRTSVINGRSKPDSDFLERSITASDISKPDPSEVSLSP